MTGGSLVSSKRTTLVSIIVAMCMTAGYLLAVAIEPSEDDNSVEASIESSQGLLEASGMKRRPNLQVGDIWTSPGSPMDGQPVQISAYVSNVGTKDIKGVVFVNRIYVDGVLLAEQVLSNLKAGESAVAFYETTALNAGDHTLLAYADFYDSVDEISESDNERLEIVSVQGLPDVAVVGIETYPSPPTIAFTYIMYTISTDAVPFTETVRTDLYIDGVFKISEYLYGSAGAGTHVYDYGVFLPVGDHVLTVITDASGTLAESSEANNELIETLHWWPKPDIRAEYVYTVPSQPIEGQPTTIRYCVATDSTPFDETLRVELFIDNRVVATNFVYGSTGAESYVYTYSAVLEEGDHSLLVAADRGNLIEESNEANNILVEVVTWLGNMDLTVIDIWTSPTYPVENQPVTIYYKIKNIGTSTAIPEGSDYFYTFLWIDGNYVNSLSLTSLGPGESYTHAYQTTRSIGSHTLSVQTDMLDYVSETNEYNNALEESAIWFEATADTDGDELIDSVEWYYGTDYLGGFNEWAIIVEGGFITGDAETQGAFANEACRAYNMLLSAGLTSNSIYFMSRMPRDANGDQINDVDDTTATYDEVMTAVSAPNGWLRSHCDKDDRVFMYFVDHGRDPDGHFLLYWNGGGGNEMYISDEEMGAWLDTVSCHRMVFVIECCFSGNFIDDCEESQRIVVSSTDAAHPGWATNPDGLINSGDEYCVFSFHFFAWLPGNSVEDAYAHACVEFQAWCIAEEVQYPFPLISDFDAVEWYL